MADAFVYKETIHDQNKGTYFTAEGEMCWVGFKCRSAYEALVLADDLRERHAAGHALLFRKKEG